MAVADPRQAQPATSHPKGVNTTPGGYITMAAESETRQASPERAGRNSFSSIRENDSDLAQTFTASKVSSYSVGPEEAVDDSPLEDDTTAAAPTATTGAGSHSAARYGSGIGTGDMIGTQFCPPVTQPFSRLHGTWFPSDSFQGWKQINVKGKLASKSFGDLQMLRFAWNNNEPPQTPPAGENRPGQSDLERLPVEILTAIIKLLVIDIPPNGVERRNVDLISLLLTSKTLHTATLDCLYQKITIPHSRIFQKFRMHVAAHPALGTMVRRLDFCHFNPASLFSTANERFQARNLTSETLLECLELTPNLQEFLAQEYIDDDLNVAVLRKLLLGLPRLQAADFCGCSSAAFKDAFTAVLDSDWPEALTIKRLSLHRCLTLPSSVFDVLLPRLRRLTHLDVAGTRITDDALWSIPPTARITHLNLAKCKLLTAQSVIRFLKEHPAVVDSLEFLSLATDARSHELLHEGDVTELIPVLPKTLKSLSLKGSKMNSSHIKQLIPLAKHLEELALGRSVKLSDIPRLFLPDPKADTNEQLAWVPHTIKYLDLSDMWSSEVGSSELFNESPLLRAYTQPLVVVEFSEEVFKRVRKSTGALGRFGWRVSETGGRSWLVRNDDNGVDDGSRPWKMGAKFWGMRKIPVAKAEVGGMYGSFMFGRKL